MTLGQEVALRLKVWLKALKPMLQRDVPPLYDSPAPI
jgi:hypothetical protein